MNNTLKNRLVATLGLFILFTALPTLADGNWTTGHTDQGRWKIGLGYLYRDRPYLGYRSSRKSEVIPLIQYIGEQFYIQGRQIGYRAYKFAEEAGELDIIAEYRNMGYRESDSAAFASNKKRSDSLDAGLRAHYNIMDFGLGLVAIHDITDTHNGTEVRAEADYTQHVTDQWTVRPSAQLIWQSGNIVRYYYGVRGKDAIPGRPAYKGNDSFSQRLAFNVSYKFLPNWNALGSVAYDHYGSEIRKSPIVNRDHQWSYVLGLMYAFG